LRHAVEESDSISLVTRNFTALFGDTTRKSIGLIFLGGLILAIGVAIFLSSEGGLGKSFGVLLLIFGGGCWAVGLDHQPARPHQKKVAVQAFQSMR